MEGARFANLFKFTAQPAHPLANHPAVSLNLRLTRPAKKAKAAALAFKVSPAAHQAALLVIEMGKLNLQATFRRGGTLPENLEDQAGAVDHLAFQLVFKVALLDRGESAVHNHQIGFVLFAPNRDILHLPGTEQGVGLHFSHRQDRRISNHHTDRKRQPFCLGQTFGCVQIIAQRADIRAQHKRPRAAGHLFLKIAIEAQPPAPLSSSSSSTMRSTGPTGWIVETACL